MSVLFQQSYYLFLWWVLKAQTQYRNMEKGSEGILPQGFSQFTKVKKGSSHLQNRQTNSFQHVSEESTGKKIEARKKVPYSKSSCSKSIFFNQPITYSMFLVSLWAIIITEEGTHRA